MDINLVKQYVTGLKNEDGVPPETINALIEEMKNDRTRAYVWNGVVLSLGEHLGALDRTLYFIRNHDVTLLPGCGGV